MCFGYQRLTNPAFQARPAPQLPEERIKPEHKVVLSLYWGAADPATQWLRHQPRTWFGISYHYVADATTKPADAQWLREVLLDFLVGESLKPIGAERAQDFNDPASVLELASSFASLVEEDEAYIFQELARSAVKAYDLGQDHPEILSKTRTAMSHQQRGRLMQEAYLRQLAAGPLGPVAVQPDAIRRVEIPSAPRSRGATRAPPRAVHAMPMSAVVQAAPAAGAQAAVAAAQLGPNQALPPLAQATTFDVSDQTNKGWELNRMCPDHVHGPGGNPPDPELAKYAFCESDTTYLIQFWICRCETGNEYFHANPHRTISWQTVGYDNCGDPDVRQSFARFVRDYFPRAVNLCRHREYVQHVLKRVGPSRTWPPMPPSLSVDKSKCLWTETVVFLDEWSADALSRGLRRDTTAIGLSSEPELAWLKLREYFFAYTVQRIVIFYGADALYHGFVDDVVTLVGQSSDHLSRHIGRAHVYYVCPPYMRNQHDAWETVIPQGMLVNQALQGLAMLVSYPLDRRLWAHLRSDPNARWPAEARREQDENANLTERGVAERKTYAVSTHGLDLWSELTQVEPEAEEILRRAEDRVHEIPHQFGRPTVHVPNYEERLKPKKKEVPPSRQSESEQTPSGSKRTAGPRKFGGRPTHDAKRGKGTGVHRTALHREFGSQLSVRSDR